VRLGQQQEEEEDTNLNFILRFLLELKVPKFWFIHFYVLSLTLATVGFIITDSRVRNVNITTHPFTLPGLLNLGTIPLEISRLAFFLFMVHSTRRFFETWKVFNYQKTSKMNISHYLVGIFFYTAINLQLFINTDFKSTTKVSFDILLLLSLILFLYATTEQFFNHAHLSRLVKYKIPHYGLFKYVCCAHYFDEMLIYLAVFGILRTRTSFLSLLFVIVNLSISAIETRNYYKTQNNGKIPKWCIIPYIL
jgi:3-oxo-5-alpha-steroid 4-dehydrogenase 3